MNRKSILVLAVAVVSLACGIALRSPGPSAIGAEKETTVKASFLDRLKPGQPVVVEDKNGRYFIGIMPKTFRPLGHTVIEVGSDYVTVRDLAEINDTRIPIFSVASIRILRAGE
jgi:hypothetical protein